MKSGCKDKMEMRARGGRMDKGREEPKEPKAKEDERTKEMVDEEKKGRKAGGRVPGRAAGGRLDRKARGGRMTPKSPFSGADTKKMPYEGSLSKLDEGGKGSPRP